MVELGELESRHEDFTKRGTRVVAVSLDGLEDTAKMSERFPHLVIVSDEQGHISSAAEVIGPHRGPGGKETLSPTTVFIDRGGRVRGVFRPDRYIERLNAEEVLAKVDEHLGGK
jgi:peroxiredoxin